MKNEKAIRKDEKFRIYALIESDEFQIRRGEREKVLDRLYGELQASQTEAEGIEVVTWSDVQVIFDILRVQQEGSS